MVMAGGEAVQGPGADDRSVAATGGDGDGDDGWGRGSATGFSGTGDTRFSITPLAWLAAGSGVVALALFAGRQALGLASGFGIEDLLGWSDPASVAAAVQLWCQFALRWRTAAAYVLADSALFVPLYAALLVTLLQGLRRALRPGPGLLAQALAISLPWLSVLCIGGLVVVDLVENFAGALRLGVPVWAALGSLCTGLGLLGVLWFWTEAPPHRRATLLCGGLATLAGALAITIGLVAAVDGAAACTAATHGALPAPAAWAHTAKPVMAALAALPIVLAAAVWWFGLDLALGDADQRAEAHDRAAWRAGAVGVVGRSRYVVGALMLFAVFTLVMDQCRDVLLALAYPDPEASTAALLWRKVVQGMCAVAVGMLSYSCWLWARLAGMVQRPGLVLPGKVGEPGAGGAASVADRVGAFARGWARALALVPLVMVAALVAYTVGDAVNASLRAARPGTVATHLAGTVIGLLGFGAFAIAFGLVLLQVRQRLALVRAADYYNSEPDFYRLLWGDSALLARRAPVPRAEQVFEPAEPPCQRRGRALAEKLAPFFRRLGSWLHPLAHPVAWPLLALLLMAGMRAAMAWRPDLTAQAPATLALLALALNWWLGVAGLLTLAEQRRATPWGLLILGLVGLFAALGWSDNHRLPMTAPPWAALEALRWHGLAAMGVLVLGAGLLWLLGTADRARFSHWPARWSDTRFNLGRAVAAFVLALAALVGLLAVDRASAPLLSPMVTAPPPANPVPRPPPSPPLADWLAQLPTPPADPGQATVLLVAAEGGGIRSAYWTAQVLARLHDADPQIDRRIAALSGVSGGAVGIAVYRACLAHRAGSPQPPGRPAGKVEGEPPAPTMRDCVEAGFKRLDGLSPLIGGLLFEDSLARVLPTTVTVGPLDLACHQPGCGHLSRALPFEREWMRQFARLGEPLGAPFGPPLMLNSTWVESGNRAVFSTLSPQVLPGSHDLVAELGVRPPLITAAHASARFPFINPLAALPPGMGAPHGHPAGPFAGGHLADGGYHDNSGTASLADLWRSLQLQLPPPWRARLVLIRNGQPRIDCQRAARSGPPRTCLDPTVRPGDAELQANLLRPADRRRLGLWTDLLGPAVALVNVSGIGAHGRQAPAALATALATQPQPLPPLFYDQLDTGDLIPLGWYLSPAARQAIEGQAALYFRPGTP
jgi:hypothetical protein